MLQYLPALEFKRFARAGKTAGHGVRLSSVALSAVNDKQRTATFVFSDGSVDREGDMISPSGWALTDFRRNPVAQYGHDSRSLPIGRAQNVRVQGNQLIGDIKFAPPEIYRFADQCFRMIGEGYLNAVSVGFMPLEWSFSRDPARRGGIDFSKQALREISVVNIPAHQSALLVGAAAGSAQQRQDRAADRARRQRALDQMRLRHGQ
jgi:HK97 family phage prohead protease